MALGLALAGAAALYDAPASAQIRDTEIENTIRTLATPLFTAAGLSPEAVNVYVLNDRTLNAFVAGGQNLFLNSGLLIRAENANQLIGVMAHETGHIAGGHLARTSEAVREASTTALLSMLLGAATAIATGNAGAAAAIATGSQSMIERSLFSFSRTQESAADQAALRYLEETGQSSRGMLEFLEILSAQELLSANRRSPYLSTHPLTTDRIDVVRRHFETSPNSKAATPPALVAAYNRMRAKLTAFTEAPARTLQAYPESDQSASARYARAVAAYRRPDLAEALKRIDELIGEYPDDPYFHETKGQILFENGRAEEAREAYRTAHRLLPDASLIRIDLARVELALDKPELTASALAHLQEAIKREKTYAFAWHQLAIAYGRDGQLALSALSLAEEYMLRRQFIDAVQQAKRAQGQLARGSPAWLRAVDIEEAARREIEDNPQATRRRRR